MLIVIWLALAYTGIMSNPKQTHELPKAKLRVAVERKGQAQWDLHIEGLARKNKLFFGEVLSLKHQHGLAIAKYYSGVRGAVEKETLRHGLNVFVYLGALAAPNQRGNVCVCTVDPTDDDAQDLGMMSMLRQIGLTNDHSPDDNFYAPAGLMIRKLRGNFPDNFALPR